MPKIAGFFHVCTMGHYEDVDAEMLDTMKSSRVLDTLDVLNICYVGGKPLKISNNGKYNFINNGLDIPQYEYPTLEYLKDYCRTNPDAYVMYCCNAGVSHDKARRDLYPGWRLLKSHFTFNRFKDHLNALTAGFDVCGVEWQEDPVRHFSGNFWWARASYINTLPSLERARMLGAKLFRSLRHGAEIWIGMNRKVKWKSLYQTGFWWLERPVINWYEEAKRCGKL